MNEIEQQAPPPLQSVTIRNLLSFGPTAAPIPLTALNVLIGPNGSGKSNLIEALALLRATPGDVRRVSARGGGVSELIWKGNPAGVASIDAIVANPAGDYPLRHTFAFREHDRAFTVEEEHVEYAESELYQNPDRKQRPFSYHFERGRAVFNLPETGPRVFRREEIATDQSILAQRRDPDLYPELAYLSEVYTSARIYREWAFGRNTVFRVPQPADMRTDRLEEDFSNLGLVLNRLRRTARTKQALLTALRDLYSGVDDFDVSVEGGTVQVFLTEGDFTIPATRLSDGTVRYLCLLAILCDPNPPSVVCIEEPELGLHPDILPKLADLLVDASHRTQLVVTTHSDILVDAMTERPEVILVCEKHQGQTQIQRLDPDQLSAWLQQYRLGQLWTRGELGGTRW